MDREVRDVIRCGPQALLFWQEVCDPDMVEPSAQLAQAQVGWLEVVGGLNSSRSTSACQELVRHL